ncbi:MAG: carotenoid biosynthesis protein [Sphingobacteriales bacterium]|jgi:putative membrane protein
MLSYPRTYYATLLAVVMHAAGAVGIVLGWGQLFSQLTPFNLLTMLGLIIWTAPQRNRSFFLFLLVAFLTGLSTEIIGVNTSILFGHYQYGSAFGPKLMGVPLLIGINWFVVVYSSGMVAIQIRKWTIAFLENQKIPGMSKWVEISAAINGALMATGFDYLMEPAAVKLRFWNWDGGEIPMLNYVSWFGISFLLMILFTRLKFTLQPFAIYLLIIQVIFFQLVLNLSVH